jgi:hypothetical protein
MGLLPQFEPSLWHLNSAMDDLADRRVRELMQQLESLIDGEAAAARLVACGRAAIEPLRRFLLESPARGVAQPRCWAAQALAGLGAKDILSGYLRSEAVIEDPVVRLAEEAVQRAAALSLAAWRTDDVFDTLLTVATRRRIPGVIEALGQFEQTDAVPVLLHALEDDFCRPWAEAGLERIADRERYALIRSALLPNPNADEEREPSLRRRRAILLLLRGVRLSGGESHRLAPLIESSDLELAVGAAALAVRYGRAEDQRGARRRLEAIAPVAPWHLHHEVQSLLTTGLESRAEREP